MFKERLLKASIASLLVYSLMTVVLVPASMLTYLVLMFLVAFVVVTYYFIPDVKVYIYSLGWTGSHGVILY